MKVGFTGTQNGLVEFQREKLKEAIEMLDPIELHHGDCIGADTEAHWMFVRYHIEKDDRERWIVIHPPNNEGKASFLWITDRWESHFKEKLRNCKYKLNVICREPFSYLARNQDIVRETEKLIATPKEMEHSLRSGTWTTIRYAWHQKKEVIIIPPIINNVVEPKFK